MDQTTSDTQETYKESGECDRGSHNEEDATAGNQYQNGGAMIREEKEHILDENDNGTEDSVKRNSSHNMKVKFQVNSDQMQEIGEEINYVDAEINPEEREDEPEIEKSENKAEAGINDIQIKVEDLEFLADESNKNFQSETRILRKRRPGSAAPRALLKPVSNPVTEHESRPENLFHEKPQGFINAQTILLQPEMHFLKREIDQPRHPRSRLNSNSSVFSDEELALVRRFPWLAERLKLAWSEVKESDGSLEKKQTAKQESKKTGSILKQRPKEEKTSLKPSEKEEGKKAKPKVVFSRNVPLFVYSSETKKAIRIGGDTSRNTLTEEVYKALEYNPELKKITLDLQDICRPDRDRTIRLAVSYLSATTNYNPLVISEHMARYSGKKEKAIIYLVNEIEKRLFSQREVRIRRDALWRKQLEDIIRARLEAEERENDIMVAKRQLEESKKEDTSIMTVTEKTQERRRRIKLRTKSIPVSERIPPPQKQRRKGVHHISLYTQELPSLLSSPVLKPSGPS